MLVLRWLRHRLDVRTLAGEVGLSIATAYRYLHEALEVIAAHAPDLEAVLAGAHAAGLLWPAPPATRTSPWTARGSGPTAATFPARPPGPTDPAARSTCGGRARRPRRQRTGHRRARRLVDLDLGRPARA
ncbi:hypothetical protein JOD57_003906 [Geodermatophilus bullaregiensis]|nr:hypothetical protein [Geodermatophilus bullaregiensis]